MPRSARNRLRGTLGKAGNTEAPSGPFTYPCKFSPFTVKMPLRSESCIRFLGEGKGKFLGVKVKKPLSILSAGLLKAVITARQNIFDFLEKISFKHNFLVDFFMCLRHI